MASFKSLRIKKQYVWMFFIKDIALVHKGAINETKNILPQYGIYRKAYGKFYMRNFWWSWFGIENQWRIVTPVEKVKDPLYYIYVWAATIRDEDDFSQAVAAEILGITGREWKGIQQSRKKKEKKRKAKTKRKPNKFGGVTVKEAGEGLKKARWKV